MTASPAIAQAEPLEPDAEWTGAHVRMLRELAEIGMELTRDLRDQALAPAYAVPEQARVAPAEAALVYSRYARAVRMTLALEARLRADHAARERDPERESARRQARWAAEEAAREAARSPAQRRREVVDLMTQRMIRAHAEREYLDDEQERYGEAESLIEHELADEDVLNRPIPQLIGIICEALGVQPDWSLWDPAAWTDKDWGLTQAEIAAGSPVPRPPRLVLPPLEPPANDAAEVQSQAQAPP